MIKILLTLLFCGFALIAKSQTPSVAQSTYGIQTGTLGIWAHKETKLSNSIALRTEIGMDAGIWGGSFYSENGYLITPVIRLEPRWYYNLNKRLAKSKNISGNSGNFLTLQTSYNPNWFVISNYDNVEVADQISIIPTWGIKRNFGSHFTYETGIGIGYRYIFAKSVGYLENEDEVALNLHLRVGYRF
ncbi:hypothetical protein M4I21_17690 [Cellulophaga sp. 20_2_10]|uniref:hypothetical protein n=1 Tax=Cellulophaga sp. 20_2_10 TaxID=2942476 RepID=UPI00201B318E|nr:hypothetical protein [Cellulophaga sp. 20_2_10]MCL5247654.1 hypothetical protein [Cellulophaga sp. 20_2_10]